MRREDAPPAGWYPDPTGGQRLWWWDGADWTDHKRVAPRAGRIAMAEEAAAAAKAAGQAAAAKDASSGYGAAPRVRAAASSRARLGSTMTRDDTTALVEEVRRATRTEIERATQGLTDRAGDARRQLEPLISEYGTKAVRWARRAAVVGVLLWVLYLAMTAAIQTGLMGWLGDRVDNAVNGTAVDVPALVLGSG